MKSFLLALLCALFVPSVAVAHATPVEYAPAASTVLLTSPSALVITFSEHIEPSASSITLFAPDGEKANVNATVSSADPRRLEAPFAEEREGAYTVSWQVVSADDGHFTKGAYTFFVGTSSDAGVLDAGASFTIVHSSGVSEAATIAFKLLGEAMIIGLLALLFLFGRNAVYEAPLRARVLEYALRFFFLGGLFLSSGALAYIVLKTSALHAVEEGSLWNALFHYSQTTAGILSWLLVLCTPCFLLLGHTLPQTLALGKRIRGREIGALLLLMTMSYSQARLSHAAASPVFRDFSIGINFVHLFGKGVWVGSILTLLGVFLPAFTREGATRRAFAFLRLIHMRVIAAAVVIAGLSGVWIVWLHLRDPRNLMTSDWGHVFMLLGFFAGLLFLLRMFSFFVLERRAWCVACTRAFFVLEAFVGLTVLFFSALIIITTPPLVQGAPWSVSSEVRGIMMQLTDDVSHQGTLLLTALDNKGSAVDGTPVVSITNSDASVGPIVIPTEKRFLGGYGIEEKDFAPAGIWTIDVSLVRPNDYDAIGHFTVDYPAAIRAHEDYQAARHFGAFEKALAALGAGIICFGILLLAMIKRRERLLQEVTSSSVAPEEPRSMGSMPRMIGIALVAYAFFVFAAWALDMSVFTSAFHKHCIAGGGMWHQSVPMKDGKALSALALSGCMVETQKGMSHYVDEREFLYMLSQEKVTIGMMMMPDGTMMAM